MAPHIIAHRGNTTGPDPSEENKPEYLYEAMNKGFDVEADIWYHDDGWWLGHDMPTHKVDEGWLYSVDDYAWFHAKNIRTLYELRNRSDVSRVFFHQNDPCTLVSNGTIWTFPGQPLTPISIALIIPGHTNTYTLQELQECEGVCTDYAVLHRDMLCK